ncbi:MAG TPA: carboxypeptidase-like regulatory domain-containing protein, partial [Calditrichia bacterium]|nr:carboxypeptidase-like regulatory domain-containing protein [Calditrichia bacterium]
MTKRLLFCLFLLALVSMAYAQSAGKISGVVTDRESGDPLPGVNVVLEETFLGASTDVDGFFVILNVPPGTYTAEFSYVGYTTVEMENIRVVGDVTKRLEIQLSSTTLELDSAIVIVADRPFFETGATNTVRVLDSEEIERVPVKGINSIVALNAGVVSSDGSGGETDNATVNVRGGRGNETLIVVDGIPYNDLIFGNATGTIPDNAIEQVSSQIGGFSAKYGSAQSGVINITTKGGASHYFGGLEGVTSQLTDDYGYRSVSGSIGGPFLPGNRNYSFFASYEYVETDDDDPKAIGNVIPGTTILPDDDNEEAYVFAGINDPKNPENESRLNRFTAKMTAAYDTWKFTASANGSFRRARSVVNSYRKHNSYHNPRVNDDVVGLSLRATNFLTETTYWDASLNYKNTYNETGDGFWFRNVEAYGDASLNSAAFPGINFLHSSLVGQDNSSGTGPGVFYGEGRVNNRYRQYNIESLSFNLNFTSQVQNHLLEVGGELSRNTVMYYNINPVGLANYNANDPDVIRDPSLLRSRESRYASVQPFFYGYDLYGNARDTGFLGFGGDSRDRFLTVDGETFMEARAPNPVIGALYLQDKIEFQDFILNAGLRWDYFMPDYFRLKDEFVPYGSGSLAERLEAADLEEMPSENYLSPRLGFAFPVTEKTVFHASYGIFRQAPRLIDIYGSWFAFESLEIDDARQADNGYLQSEKTTQYEFGFKQQMGEMASLDITAYYKNIEGLTNVVSKFYVVGTDSTRRWLTTDNTDFGTVRGLATSFNLRRLGPVSAKIDYTISVAEGTGSSQSSSYTAAFRNNNGEVPKTIAPLDFDQRHTLTANFDIRGNKGDGPGMGNFYPLENAGANI